MTPIKILVCDDHPAVRESIKIILDSPRYCLWFAQDGQKAIEEAKRLKPKIILLDIKMPKLSGLDAIEEIKLINPEVKIIIISGYEQPEVIKEALSRGAADYLSKSFSAQQLKDSIASVLAKKS